MNKRIVIKTSGIIMDLIHNKNLKEGGFLRPKIGITCYFDFEKNRFTAGGDYVRAIAGAGGVPLLIPAAGEAENYLDAADGFLFSGGGDFAPVHYEEAEAVSYLRSVDEQRDKFEMDLLQLLRGKNVPVFGICRGMQIMNLVLGGSLFYHLASLQNFQEHFLVDEEEQTHFIKIEQKSLLGDLAGKSWLAVNSRHHQGVKKLAEGLQAIAWAGDGLIEAFIDNNEKFWLGVQWHPENLAAANPVMQGLFTRFVRACGSY